MTDASTLPPVPDDAPAEDEPEAPASGFHIVVGVDEFLQLEERVALLEARIPAGADDDPDEDVTAGRLNRHRGEIEELKRRYNRLVDYLAAILPAPGKPPVVPVPAAPVIVPPVDADDTIQPTRTPAAMVVPLRVSAAPFNGDMTDTGSLL